MVEVPSKLIITVAFQMKAKLDHGLFLGVYKLAGGFKVGSMSQLWCNGQWFNSVNFSVSPLDRGGILGLGLFETMLAVDGVPMFVPQHLARLEASCQKLGWQLDLPDLKKTAAKLLVKNQLGTGRARVRLTVTAGSGTLRDLKLGPDHLVWMAALPAGNSPACLTANLSPWPRNEYSPLAGLKCTSYAENLVALDHARRQGFEETIFLNTAGRLCEAATANLFLVKNGTLLTPSLAAGCLPGIARQIVLEMAAGQGIACDERSLGLGDLQTADEVILTSAIHGPVCLSRFEEKSFNHSPVVEVLRKLWNDKLQPLRGSNKDV